MCRGAHINIHTCIGDSTMNICGWVDTAAIGLRARSRRCHPGSRTPAQSARSPVRSRSRPPSTAPPPPEASGVAEVELPLVRRHEHAVHPDAPVVPPLIPYLWIAATPRRRRRLRRRPGRRRCGIRATWDRHRYHRLIRCRRGRWSGIRAGCTQSGGSGRHPTCNSCTGNDLGDLHSKSTSNPNANEFRQIHWLSRLAEP